MGKKQEVDINITIDLANLNSITKGNSSHQSKIRVSLSVSQLAYVCKVLAETGIIKTKNVSEMLRFIADGFSTPGAEQISFDSLRMKYYNPEASCKQSVKEMILKQLNYVQKDLNQ